MKDYIEIGPSPINESCVQLGDPDYYNKARIECNHYIDALRKKLGPEPECARLHIKSCPHDFGTYYEVVCDYNTDFPNSEKYALDCESNGPLTWNEVGMAPPNFGDI